MIHRLFPYHPNKGLSAKMRALAVDETLILAAGSRRGNLWCMAKNVGIKVSYKTLEDGSVLLRRTA